MTESEVVIGYRSKSLILSEFAGAFGVASIVFAIVTLLFTMVSVKGHLREPFYFGALVVMVIFPPSRWTARCFSKSCITMTPDTIKVPARFCASMHGRLQRLWSDVSHIALINSHGSTDGKLVLYFKSGGHAAISLDRIERNRLEEFLLCIEMRADGAKRDLGLAAMLDVLHYEKTNKGDISFTKLWELDINRRFAPMAYVPLEPEQVIQNGNIRILAQLTFGGLSAVYLAEREPVEGVIVKEAAIPAGTDPEQLAKAQEMLKREAGMLMELSHPQIVKVLDFFIEASRAYLILEYLPGENLRQIVYRTGAVSEDTALEWAHQLCGVLQYLHHRQPPVVHRDITPDNIMVDTNGKVVLIDFGTANEFVATATGTLVGKQAYMPLEQFKGKAIPASDIYSLGATMHFLLTGADPEPLCELQPKLVNYRVSKQVDALVTDCTHLDLEARINDVDELKQRIEKIVAQNSIVLKSSAAVISKDSTRE